MSPRTTGPGPNRDGVIADRAQTVDVVLICSVGCMDDVTDAGTRGRTRLASLARRHTAKTGHTTGLSITRLVSYVIDR